MVHHGGIYVDYVLTLQSALFLHFKCLSLCPVPLHFMFQLRKTSALFNFMAFTRVLVQLAPQVQLSQEQKEKIESGSWTLFITGSAYLLEDQEEQFFEADITKFHALLFRKLAQLYQLHEVAVEKWPAQVKEFLKNDNPPPIPYNPKRRSCFKGECAFLTA